MRSLLVLVLLGGVARADVTVDLKLNANGQQLAQQLGLTSQQLAQRIAARIDQVFATDRVGSFLQTFADTSAFSGRGLGVDYGSLPDGALFGMSATGALATGNETFTGSPLVRGMAANLALMGGLNLAHWGHPRVTMFANGFYRNASTDELAGGIASVGAHVQIAVIEPQEPQTVRWIGVDLTTGVEVTRWTLGSTHPIGDSFAIAGSRGQTMEVALDQNGRFDLEAATATIPVEASTGVRVANFIALYVGGAADLSGGAGTVSAATMGELRDAGGRSIGTVAIAGASSRAMSPFEPRALAGAQLELAQMKLVGQVNVAPSLASVGLGIRFVL